MFLFQTKIFFCFFFQKTNFYLFLNNFSNLINQKYSLKVQRYSFQLLLLIHFYKSSLIHILINHLIFNDLYIFNYLKFYYISKLIHHLNCRFLKNIHYPYFLYRFLFIFKLVYLFLTFLH